MKIDICDDIVVFLEFSGVVEELKFREKSKKFINGIVFVVDVRKFFICINCKFKIGDIDEKSVFKCLNCNLKMRKIDMICSSIVNIIIKNENGENVGWYYCFYLVM